MRFSGELSIPFGPIADPLACGLHLLGALYFGSRAIALVRSAGGARRRQAGLALFAATAVLVLGVSASYHALALDHPWKRSFQLADHAAIFLLIASTLSGFHSVAFHGGARVWAALVTWLLALGALTYKTAAWASVGSGTGLALYFGLSALGFGAVVVLPRRLPWRAYAVMALGALVYVSGALSEQLGWIWIVPGWLGPHELFHAAVICALFIHWRFFLTWSAPGRVRPPREGVLPSAASASLSAPG